MFRIPKLRKKPLMKRLFSVYLKPTKEILISLLYKDGESPGKFTLCRKKLHVLTRNQAND